MLRRATWNHVTLRRRDGAAEESLRLEIVGRRDGHFINITHGRRGSKLTTGTATPSAVTLGEAEVVYRDLVRAKVAEGYSIGEVAVAGPRPSARKPGTGAALSRARAGTTRSRRAARAAGAFLIRSGRGKPFDFGVRQAKIRFAREGSAWLVGLEILSDKHGDDLEDATLHLRDFPVHGVDVRSSRLQIRFASAVQVSTALGHWVTNLYRGEHTPTDENRIEIMACARGRFRVKWSGRGESMGDRFEVDCVAAEVRKIPYLSVEV